MNGLQIVTSFLYVFASTAVLAGQDGPGDFTAAADVLNFDVLGSPSFSHVSPLLIGVDSYRRTFTIYQGELVGQRWTLAPSGMVRRRHFFFAKGSRP